MAKRIITKRIGDILLERGIVNRQELEQALAQQKERGGLLGQVLVEMGAVTEEEVALALTAQYGFPYLPLESYEIDDAIARLVPEQVARQYVLIPIDQIGNALSVAMADPSNLQAVEDIELLTSCIVQTFVSTPSDIRKAIGRCYPSASAGPAPASGPSPSEPRP
ncbi:MAG: hypothetical protein HYY15_03765 [Candidatus Omnitrophica bacterium]|nr:hypothetical protein [Candidatus Omnitrophota bacterium]